MAIEKRILTAHAALRAESQGDELVLRGYAARFNVLSHPLPQGFREQIQPGAFKRSLAAGDDVVATFNHDSDKVLGRVRSGTLKLAEDEKGLAFRCQLDPNQSSHRDLHAAVKRGDISDCSFAFSVPDDGDDFSEGTDEKGQRCLKRTLRNVTLHDVSVVTHPAYPQTSVDARKAVARVDDQAQIRRQIVAYEKRKAEKRQTIAQAQHAMADYPELDLETIARCKRLGYSEDAMLEMRAAAITKIIRAGFAFEAGVQSPRYNSGQSEDPQQLLRTACTPDQHKFAADFHRVCASTAKSMQRCIDHHRCADAHSRAAQSGDSLDSAAARAASKLIFPESSVS